MSLRYEMSIIIILTIWMFMLINILIRKLFTKWILRIILIITKSSNFCFDIHMSIIT